MRNERLVATKGPSYAFGDKGAPRGLVEKTATGSSFVYPDHQFRDFSGSTSRQDSKDTLRQEPSYSNPDSGFRESSRSTSRHDDSPRYISPPSRRWYDEYDGPPLSSNFAVTMMKGKDTVGAQKEIGMSDDLLEEIAMTVIS
jgi:hypothetical protein